MQIVREAAVGMIALVVATIAAYLFAHFFGGDPVSMIAGAAIFHVARLEYSISKEPSA